MTHTRSVLERIAEGDDPGYERGSFVGEPITVRLPIAIHANRSGAIVVNYPGANGDIDGYYDKYVKIADSLQRQNVGAVVRTANREHYGLLYADAVQADLRHVIRYALRNAEDICGSETPHMYLMGFSAGAGAIAAVAHEFGHVEKILLMAPSGDAGRDAVYNGLAQFSGEVYIAIGENDEVVGKDAGQLFYDLAVNARSRQLVVIPDCDHQFRGEINGRIMSKAPFWAFTGDTTFPSPEGGIKLYD